jgi:hypothetical protein
MPSRTCKWPNQTPPAWGALPSVQHCCTLTHAVLAGIGWHHQAALEAGFQLHLAKRYDLTRLIAIIAQLALAMKPSPLSFWAGRCARRFALEVRLASMSRRQPKYFESRVPRPCSRSEQRMQEILVYDLSR